MSESEDEFASAGEEVEEEGAQPTAKGEGKTERSKKDTQRRKTENVPNVSKQKSTSASGKKNTQEKEKKVSKDEEVKPKGEEEKVPKDVEEKPKAEKEEKAEEEEEKPKEVIQRQPIAGLASTEEPKSARTALDNLAAKETASSGWGFGGWGSSLLNTARSSVNAFTSQLGEGIHSVVETVESALDVPPPEEVARAKAAGDSAGDGEKEKEEEEKKEEKKEEEGVTEEKGEEKEKTEQKTQHEAGWWDMTSSVMSSAQKTTRSLMTGGLDVLETIGKKTMEALHETDPGLSRTRELLGGRTRTGATLSQALREARERHEEAALREERWEEERLGHFGAQFEDCQGLAHLEALELLASRCEAKLYSRLGQMTGDPLAAAKADLVRLKAAFERAEEEEEEEEEDEEGKDTQSSEEVWAEVERSLEDLQLTAKEEVLKTMKVKTDLMTEALRAKSSDAAEEGEDEGEKEAALLQALQRAGVQLLAHATASWVSLFHKAGELALAGALRWGAETSEGEKPDLMALTERIVNCALLASRSIGGLGEEVATVMRQHSSDNSRRLSTQLVSAVYLETGNSKSYVRDALLLLLPVVQLSALPR